MKKKKIKATFKIEFGTSRRFIRALIGAIVFTFMVMIVFIVAFVLDHDYELLAASIVFYLFGIVLMALVLAEKIKPHKEIEKWMQDAIEYDVQCTSVEKNGKKDAICVKFDYNGRTITKVSNGCSRYYTKCVGKEIKILYSPKYDEVMILSINK